MVEQADVVGSAPAGHPRSDQRRHYDRPRLGWALAFLGFFLVIGAWSVAAPYDGTPDEKEHVIRAAGVVDGQVVVRPEAAAAGGGAFQVVPGSLVRDNCWRRVDDRSAACATEPGGDQTPVRAATGAGRYHPLYYAVVGWPLGLSPDWTGILLARLLSAALSAGLLATALTDAMLWARHRIVAAGVLAAVTPMAAHMASAVNPSGLEISAAVALFAAAVPLLHHGPAGRSPALLRHVGLAALALATLRTAGPVWLALSAAALVLPFGWRKLRELWAWTPVRRWALAVAVAGAGSVAWSLLLHTNAASQPNIPAPLTWAQAARAELERWPRYADEMVGVLSWLDVRMPAPGYLVWQYAVAGLVIWAFVVAGRTGRVQLAALTVVGVGVPYVVQVALANRYGFITQGRYLLPVLVGLPILAAYLIEREGLSPDRGATLVRLYAVLLLPVHLVALVFTMVRWQQGLHNGGGPQALNPLVGDWQPPLGPALPLVATAAGLGLLGWLVWRDRPKTPAEPAAVPPAPAEPAAVPRVPTQREPVPPTREEPPGVPRVPTQRRARAGDPDPPRNLD